jgi:hypothetical protein
MRTRELVLGGLLAAISLLIPLYFRGTFQIVIPAIGFSATLASHVPYCITFSTRRSRWACSPRSVRC